MVPSQQMFEAQSAGTFAYVKKDRCGGTLGHSRLSVRQRPSPPLPSLSFLSQPCWLLGISPAAHPPPPSGPGPANCWCIFS
eukprot:7325907-Pyramimonas_sp.AAC.1